MNNKNDDQALRKIIMDHYINPSNKGFSNNMNAISIDLKSPTCSDELKMEIIMDGNKINSLKFEGTACAVATSAADILINNLVNQDLKTAKILIMNYELLLKNDLNVDENKLRELIVFKNVYKQKNRIACATLFSNGVKEFIEAL